MTRLSKYPLALDVWESITADFYLLVSLLSDEKEIAGFLEDFLTRTEKVMFSKRLAIALMLSGNFAYEDISKALKVSPSTIFAIQNSLERSRYYKRAVERIIGRRRVQEFFKVAGKAADKAVSRLLLPMNPADKKGWARFKNPDFVDYNEEDEAIRKRRTSVWETTSLSRIKG